jgi:hypothetical protein
MRRSSRSQLRSTELNRQFGERRNPKELCNGPVSADSLNAVKKELATSKDSPEAGQDPSTIRLNYFKTTSSETANLDQWIQQQQDASNRGQAGTYNFLTNNCAQFCQRGLVLGGAITQSDANHMSNVPNTFWAETDFWQQWNNQMDKSTVTITACDTLPDGSQRCY